MAVQVRGPLSRSVAETATDLWNDSCGVAELEAAIALGAVGATANPTIVGDVWKGDPADWQRPPAISPPRTRRGPRSTSRGPSSRRCHCARRRCCFRPSSAPAAGRAGSRCRPTPRSGARPDRMLEQGIQLRRPGAQHHRQVPGDGGRHRGDGGGDVPRRQRQLHGQLQRQPGGRGGRGGRARAAPARGGGPAGRPDGPGHHDHDGPASRTGCGSRSNATGSSSTRRRWPGRASRSSSGPTGSSVSADCAPAYWARRSVTTTTGASSSAATW